MRRCVGAAFATLEMKVVLRTVLERVELAAPRQADERPHMSGVFVMPARGGQVVVKKRLPERRGQLVSAA